MKIAQILLLIEMPLSARDYDRFGVDILNSNFDTHIIDFSKLINPKFYEEEYLPPFGYKKYHVINSLIDLKIYLNSNIKMLTIDYLGETSIAKNIRKEIKKNNIKIVKVCSGLIPQPSLVKKTKKSLFNRIIFKRVFTKIWNDCRYLVEKKYENPDIVLYSSGESVRERRFASAKYRIYAHSFDYDLYLKYRNSAEHPKYKYAVYLDSDIAFHPEYEITGVKKLVTPEIHFPAINAYFNDFERITGLKVIIAAHPKSRYDLRPNLYGERKPIIGQTPQLIRDSSMVLTIASTAISYAVLWHKPILLLNTNEYNKSDHSPYQDVLSKKIRALTMNIDSYTEYDLGRIKNIKIAAKLYKKYEYDYIKYAGSEDLPVWEIFSKFVFNKFRI